MSNISSRLPVGAPGSESIGHLPGNEPSSWFAAYTTPRHEKKVAQHFELREIESFLPLYAVQRRWKDGSKVKLHLPLFPNYIFVRIPWRDRVQVLAVPGVVAIVSRGLDPVPLSDSEIETLRSGIHLLRAEPHPSLRLGTRVRIRSGALAGWEGVLVRKKNEFRVVLTLEQIMKSIAVEIDADELEPLARPFPGTSNS